MLHWHPRSVLRLEDILVSSPSEEMDVLYGLCCMLGVLSPGPGELQSSLSGPINESGSTFALFLLKGVGGLLHLRA